MKLTLVIAALLAVLPARAAPFVRSDIMIDSAPKVRLHLRHVRAGAGGQPILLIHGARMAGVASFDLPVAGGSLAADLVARKFDVYLLDVRGYGGSTRPAAMDDVPDGKAALVRSDEAVADIDAAVDHIRRVTKRKRVALFGWATGGQWAGHYASLHSGKLSALILLNSLYRGISPHLLLGRGSVMEDPAAPGQFNRAACGAYRFSDAGSILGPWNASIPGEDKSAWRDPLVERAFVVEALAADGSSERRHPASARSPCGAMEDSFYMATGRQLWDASLITAPVLIVRSERDFWSRQEDASNLRADLVHSPASRLLVLPDTSHFVHLERAERGRERLIREVSEFVASHGEARLKGR